MAYYERPLHTYRGCSVARSHSTLCEPLDYSPPGSSCLWNFSSKNTGVGCHFPPPSNLLNSGIKPTSLLPPAFTGGVFTTSATWEDFILIRMVIIFQNFSKSTKNGKCWGGCRKIKTVVDCFLKKSTLLQLIIFLKRKIYGSSSKN